MGRTEIYLDKNAIAMSILKSYKYDVRSNLGYISIANDNEFVTLTLIIDENNREKDIILFRN